MPTAAGENRAIEPNELLYRRIQEKDYAPEKSEFPDHLAFRPNEHDVDGISLFRASMVQPRDVAIGPHAKAGKRYYVGPIRARALLDLDLRLVPDDMLPPTDDAPIPGHLVVPELNAHVRRDPKVTDLAYRLSRAVELPILGPFYLDATPRAT